MLCSALMPVSTSARRTRAMGVRGVNGFVKDLLTEAERPTDKKVVIHLATLAEGVKSASYLERM